MSDEAALAASVSSSNQTTARGAAFVMEFALPWFPPEVEPNARVHRAVKAKAAKGYKHDCWLLTRSEMVRRNINSPLPAPVTLHLTFLARNPLRDVDNCVAACKNLIDALTAAGLIVGDNSKQLTVTASVEHARVTQEVRVRMEATS